MSAPLTDIDGTRPPTPLVHEPDRKRQLICGPPQPSKPYPLFLEGTVMRGFGRGSKDLGCPTANLHDEVIANFKDSDLEIGVHFGFARVNHSSTDQPGNTEHDQVYPMVMSIGWNPFYNNVKRTAEVHILHDFPSDFYGHHLKIAILGFIRPEYNYSSLEALVEDIETDKRAAKASLTRPDYLKYKSDPFFTQPPLF